jgi:hypothetical protein
LPFTFTDSGGNAINCNSWTLSTTAKFYTADNITYSNIVTDEINIGNLTLLAPQPTASAYSALTAAFTTPATGIGYIYIPSTLTGGTGSPNPTPIITLANSAANSTLVVITLGVSRTDALSGLVDFNREPIGMIVRFQ